MSDTGHTVRKCIGFGEFDRRCPNVAGPNPNWCPRCDALRMAHLNKRFAQVAQSLGLLPLTDETGVAK